MDGNYQDLITTAKQHRNIWGISQAHGLSPILWASPYSSAGDFRGGNICGCGMLFYCVNILLVNFLWYDVNREHSKISLPWLADSFAVAPIRIATTKT